MTLAAVIPARGDDLAEIDGVPLVVRSVEVARAAGIHTIYVTTESDEVAKVAASAGALLHQPQHRRFVARPGSDDALIVWWRHFPRWVPRPDTFVVLSPSSPLTGASDVRACLRLLRTNPELDTTHTAVRSRRHLFAGTLLRHPGGAAMLVPDRKLGRRKKVENAPPRAHEGGGCWVVRGPHFDKWKTRDAMRPKRSAQVLIPEVRDIEVQSEDELRLARAYVREFGWP